MGSIEVFVGDNIEVAKHYPVDVGFLLGFESAVAHYGAFNAEARVRRDRIQVSTFMDVREGKA